MTRLRRKATKHLGAANLDEGRRLRAEEYMHWISLGEVLSIDCEHFRSVRVRFRKHTPRLGARRLRCFSSTVGRQILDNTGEWGDRFRWHWEGAGLEGVLVVEEDRWDVEVVSNLICLNNELDSACGVLEKEEKNVPVPTIVHTLVSPMSTCQSAPEEAPESLPEPRREETDPAELGRRRFLPTGLASPPALEVDLFFFTRPPSFDAKSAEDGEGGSLSPFPK